MQIENLKTFKKIKHIFILEKCQLIFRLYYFVVTYTHICMLEMINTFCDVIVYIYIKK